jgi:hypothetical protein
MLKSIKRVMLTGLGLVSFAAVSMISISSNKSLTQSNQLSDVTITVGGEPAQAWIYEFLKDTFQPISNETIGRLFTQEWLTSYDSQQLEEQEGGAAWTKANDMCKKELRNRTGRTVSDLSVSVRKEGQVYNCFERKYKY